MKRIQTIATVLLAAGLALGATACGDNEEGSSSESEADLHLEVGSAVCDFAADEVECYYEAEQEEDGYWESVQCGGENSTCEFEIEFALLDGELYEGAIGLADSEGFEVEGELEFDSVEVQEADGLLSASFSGTVDDGGTIEVSGWFEELEWSEGEL